MVNNDVLMACQQGIEAWKTAFNLQDAKGCASQYAEDCTMHARPFGTFKGREEIQAFWQDIMDKGFADVAYTDVKWEICGDNGYILTSKWSMNKAFGVVHKEHWVVESDGCARLVHDDFEILGER
ncbi:YybH family protein [Vibrio astriarenae]|uniref:YybH family protein n=1 Tax=Vibrio astriarenae TaxID=1481923 RepID=UPI003736869A